MQELPEHTWDHHIEWKNPCAAVDKAEDDASHPRKGAEAVVSGEGGMLCTPSDSEKANKAVSRSKFPLSTEQAFISISYRLKVHCGSSHPNSCFLLIQRTFSLMSWMEDVLFLQWKQWDSREEELYASA